MVVTKFDTFGDDEVSDLCTIGQSIVNTSQIMEELRQIDIQGDLE